MRNGLGVALLLFGASACASEINSPSVVGGEESADIDPPEPPPYDEGEEGNLVSSSSASLRACEPTSGVFTVRYDDRHDLEPLDVSLLHVLDDGRFVAFQPRYASNLYGQGFVRRGRADFLCDGTELRGLRLRFGNGAIASYGVRTGFEYDPFSGKDLLKLHLRLRLHKPSGQRSFQDVSDGHQEIRYVAAPE